MNYLLTRKKSFCSKQLKAGFITFSFALSNKRLKEAKSTLYTHLSYKIILAIKNSFIDKFDKGI
jgi:hypothetical protein